MESFEAFADDWSPEGGSSTLFSTEYWYHHSHGAYKHHKHPHRGSHRPRPGARGKHHHRRKGLHHHHRGVHEHHHVRKGRKHPHRGYHGPRDSPSDTINELLASKGMIAIQGVNNAPVNRSITQAGFPS